MASTIRLIIDNYIEKVQQIKKWMNSPQMKQKMQYNLQLMEKVGMYFLRFTVLAGFQGTQCVKINQIQLSELVNLLSKQLENKFKYNANLIYQILGVYINQKFKRVQFFQEMVHQIGVLLRMHSSIPNISQCQPLENSQVQSSFIGQKTQTQIQFFDQKDDSSQLLNYAQFLQGINFQRQDSKFSQLRSVKDRINNYLKKISNPNTQLNLLVQQMNWQLPQYTSNTYQSNYSCSLNILWKNQRILVKQQTRAKNKKQGRLNSSFLVLKKIYFEFPEIWQTFIKIKLSKNIEIQGFTKQQIFEQQASYIHSSQQLKNPNNIQQIKQYLQNISGKTQMNLLCQSLKFQSPQHTKSEDKGKWIVNSIIKFTYNGRQQSFKQKISHANSKTGQQVNCKELLLKIYSAYPLIWVKMKSIKESKGIH